MIFWNTVLVGLAIVAAAVGLYGLHRLCLWLEQRGLLFYIHKKPGSTAGCFTALQQAIEPQTKHVLHVKEEKRQHSENEAPGQGDADAPSTDRR